MELVKLLGLSQVDFSTNQRVSKTSSCPIVESDLKRKSILTEWRQHIFPIRRAPCHTLNEIATTVQGTNPLSFHGHNIYTAVSFLIHGVSACYDDVCAGMPSCLWEKDKFHPEFNGWEEILERRVSSQPIQARNIFHKRESNPRSWQCVNFQVMKFKCFSYIYLFIFLQTYDIKILFTYYYRAM